MQRTIAVTESIAVPAEQAWAAIAAVGGLDRWFPVIDACRVDGAGAGARRVMDLVAGGRIVDHIIEIDEAHRRLGYDRVESPLPVNRYLGTVQVEATGTDSCTLTWHVDLDVDPEAADAVVSFLTEAISAGVGGLRNELVGT